MKKAVDDVLGAFVQPRTDMRFDMNVSKSRWDPGQGPPCIGKAHTTL